MPWGLRTVEKFPKISPRNFVFRIWRRSTPRSAPHCAEQMIWSVLKKRNMTHSPALWYVHNSDGDRLYWFQHSTAWVQIIRICIHIWNPDSNSWNCPPSWLVLLRATLNTPSGYCDCNKNGNPTYFYIPVASHWNLIARFYNSIFRTKSLRDWDDVDNGGPILGHGCHGIENCLGHSLEKLSRGLKPGLPTPPPSAAVSLAVKSEHRQAGQQWLGL